MSRVVSGEKQRRGIGQKNPEWAALGFPNAEDAEGSLGGEGEGDESTIREGTSECEFLNSLKQPLMMVTGDVSCSFVFWHCVPQASCENASTMAQGAPGRS